MRNLIIAGCFLAIVYPLHTFAESGIQYCNPTSTAIPDDGNFLTDTIVVPPGEEVEDVAVSVDISHTRVNDLSIALLHDTQSMVIFQYRGCAGADLNATFSDDGPAITCNETPPVISGTVASFTALSGFDGLDSQGDWTIEVIDDTLGEAGTLNQWCITITKVNIPPTASFTESCADLVCDFTDTSTDPDGTIVEWYWSFEDGTGSSSTEQNPSYTFPVRGTFGVFLTAYDDRGDSDVYYRAVENYPNTHPVVDPQILEVLEDTTLPITLTGSDGDDDPLWFYVSTPPQNGNIDEGDFGSDPLTTQVENSFINEESSLVHYRSFANYHGPDVFEFVANDGYDDSEPATVSITVKPVNDPPVFVTGPDPQWPVAETGAKSHPGWISYMATGPEDSENDQSIVDFIVDVDMDPDNVVSAVDVQNDGTLEYTLTGNSGSAVIMISATDDGGTADGGIDTSEPRLATITVLHDASTLPAASYAGYSQLPAIYPTPEVCCFDYTGDGVPDNAFGVLAATLANLGINANEEMAKAIEAGAVTKLLFWKNLPSLGGTGPFELEFGNGSWSGNDDYPTRVAGEGEFVYDSDGLEGHPPNIQDCVVDETANFQCTGDTLSLPLTLGGAEGGLSEVDLSNIMIEGQYVADAPGCAGLCSVNETAVEAPVVHGGVKIGGLMQLDAYFNTLEQSFQSCVCFGDGNVQLFEYGEGESEYTFTCTAEGEQAASECQACIDRNMNLVCSLSGPLIIGAADIDTNSNGVVDSFSVGVRMGVSGANIVGCSGDNCVEKPDEMFDDGFEGEPQAP